MSYVAVRSIKVQTATGKVEIRMPGQEIPEAADWANPGLWVKRGYIRPKDGTMPVPGVDRDKLLPAREATVEDAERSKAPVPKPEEPLEGYTGSAEVQMDSKTLMKLTNAELEELGSTFDLNLDGMVKKEMVEAILEASKE